MKGLVSLRWWPGLLGLMLLTGSSVGQERRMLPPVKVNTVFDFRVEFKVGPDIQRPTAPWYAYFPADPRMSPSLQSSPYPPWPQQFPPPGPPSDAKDALKKLSAESVPSGPMPWMHWPHHHARGPILQPVGYSPQLVPSYWYQQR